ncbi:hypothetical protein ACFX1W_041177 [Malus domestica]
MLSPTILSLPDLSKTFVIETDASNTCIGAVLQQKGRSRAFTSKAFGPRSQAMSAYEREMLAIVHAIKKWQTYLHGNHFVVCTDHHSLKYFLQNRVHTQFQQKWISKLLGFDYEIQYKQGTENQVVDALSWLHSEAQLCAISYPYMGLLDDLRIHLEQEPWVISKLKDPSIAQGAVDTSSSNYHYDNGCFKHKGQIVLSPTTNWRDKIFHEHHSTLMAGHSGFLKTYKRISHSFY